MLKFPWNLWIQHLPHRLKLVTLQARSVVASKNKSWLGLIDSTAGFLFKPSTYLSQCRGEILQVFQHSWSASWFLSWITAQYKLLLCVMKASESHDYLQLEACVCFSRIVSLLFNCSYSCFLVSLTKSALIKQIALHSTKKLWNHTECHKQLSPIMLACLGFTFVKPVGQERHIVWPLSFIFVNLPLFWMNTLLIIIQDGWKFWPWWYSPNIYDLSHESQVQSGLLLSSCTLGSAASQHQCQSWWFGYSVDHRLGPEPHQMMTWIFGLHYTFCLGSMLILESSWQHECKLCF